MPDKTHENKRHKIKLQLLLKSHSVNRPSPVTDLETHSNGHERKKGKTKGSKPKVIQENGV